MSNSYRMFGVLFRLRFTFLALRVLGFGLDRLFSLNGHRL
jgi:hypothetical protein